MQNADPNTRRIRFVMIGIGIATLVVWYLTKPQPETTSSVPVSESIVPAAVGVPTSPGAPSPVQGQGQAVQSPGVRFDAGEVVIEDGKTIDFSSGAPVVRDNAQEKEIIDRALKEMEAAASNITFGPAP